MNNAVSIIHHLRDSNTIIPYCAGFLSPDEASGPTPKSGVRGERYVRKSCLSAGQDQLDGLNQFVRGVLRSHLVTVAMHLNQVIFLPL